MPADAKPEPVAPKPKRRWLQFGLRTLLGLIALAAVGMGLWVNSAERQRRAVEFVRSLGGNVLYDDTDLFSDDSSPHRAWYRKLLGDDYFRSVVGVELDKTKVTDAGLTHLKRLTRLELLYLDGTQVTDAGLEHLKGLTQLQWLRLDGTPVTDVGLAHLKRLRRLKVLYLRDTVVTPEGVDELSKALPECEFSGP